MKKYLFANWALSLALVMTPVSVFAHSGADDETHVRGRGATEDRVHAEGWARWTKLFSIPKVDNSCTAIESRVDAVINKYDTSTDHKVNAYLSLKTKVANFEAQASAAGYDTAELQADMPGLNSRVDQFAADYSAYINSLKVLRTYACDGEDGQFAAQLTTAKQLLATARTSGLAVKTYFHDEIKVDIKNIWAQIKADYGLSFSL